MQTAILERAETPQGEWFASWFDSDDYHNLYAHRDHSEAAKFIDRLAGQIRPFSGARALDLGCGAGRHARQLAARGFDVTGLDLSEASIRTANAFANERLRFARHDMRVPFGDNSFDYVFNLFTSFGYFDTADEHLAVIRNMASALVVGGRLVLDYLNVQYAAEREVPWEVVERAGTRYDISRRNDAAHFYKRIVVSNPRMPGPLAHVERVAKFTAHDFTLMFSLYGMRIDEIYGDYRLSPFAEASSPRLILIARKER